MTARRATPAGQPGRRRAHTVRPCPECWAARRAWARSARWHTCGDLVAMGAGPIGFEPCTRGVCLRCWAACSRGGCRQPSSRGAAELAANGSPLRVCGPAGCLNSADRSVSICMCIASGACLCDSAAGGRLRGRDFDGRPEELSGDRAREYMPMRCSSVNWLREPGNEGGDLPAGRRTQRTQVS